MKIVLIFFVGLTIAVFGIRWSEDYRNSKLPLPPRFEVRTLQEARTLAGPHAVAVLGTGSMKPYIPSSPNPADVVAFATCEFTPYDQLKKGDLVVYRRLSHFIIHQIVAQQGAGWISSGLNNPRYDAICVNQQSYHSRVVRVYILAPAEDPVGEKKLR